MVGVEPQHDRLLERLAAGPVLDDRRASRPWRLEHVAQARTSRPRARCRPRCGGSARSAPARRGPRRGVGDRRRRRRRCSPRRRRARLHGTRRAGVPWRRMANVRSIPPAELALAADAARRGSGDTPAFDATFAGAPPHRARRHRLGRSRRRLGRRRRRAVRARRRATRRGSTARCACTTAWSKSPASPRGTAARSTTRAVPPIFRRWPPRCARATAARSTASAPRCTATGATASPGTAIASTRRSSNRSSRSCRSVRRARCACGRKRRAARRRPFLLLPGDLFVMGGATPDARGSTRSRRSRSAGARVSLQFRHST